MPQLLPAGNASEWTGPTGTNAWLLPGRVPALVDSGVGRPEFVDAVARALEGAPLARVCVTHGHMDHSGGVDSLRARWPSIDVVTFGSFSRGGRPAVKAGDTTLDILATPGHAPDHLCFFDPASRDLYCGDLLRRGGTVVIPARSGGDLGAYLESLGRIRALAPSRLLPGHGPIVTDPVALIDEYVAHRAAREQQIVEALRGGARTAEEIADLIYIGLSPTLRAAAIESVEAHLAKLAAEKLAAEKKDSPGPS